MKFASNGVICENCAELFLQFRSFINYPTRNSRQMLLDAPKNRINLGKPNCLLPIQCALTHPTIESTNKPYKRVISRDAGRPDSFGKLIIC
jgi:hypothetical protein